MILARLRRSRTKMPNTYTQIHIHFVFAVKNRQALINEPIRNRIEKYITGIVQNFGHKLLSIYCMPDHAHLFVGLKPDQSISDLMREVKSKSSEFINMEKLTKEKFNWQEGYGAFSYSHSQIQNVINYVLNQAEHHKKKTFKEEYFEFLNKFEISYEEKYLFNWIEIGSTPTEPQSME
jgi:putative transposase